MNKKVLVVLMVLVLAVAGLSAKGSVKAGAQLGWGFDIASMNVTEKNKEGSMGAKNNGFAFALTGEYAFDKNWSVKANFGMMFAGKATAGYNARGLNVEVYSEEASGLYIDAAIDAKYTYAINKQISVAGFAGFELVSGQLLKDFDSVVDQLGIGYDDSNFANVGFGVNLGVEGAYQLTNEVAITGGVNFAWLFVNSFSSTEFAKSMQEEADKFSVNSFYIRPYHGATYAF